MSQTVRQAEVEDRELLIAMDASVSPGMPGSGGAILRADNAAQTECSTIPTHEPHMALTPSAVRNFVVAVVAVFAICYTVYVTHAVITASAQYRV